MGLEFMEGATVATVKEIADHGAPIAEDVSNGWAGLLYVGSIFPEEERWALVWERVEENPETARRIRNDPETRILVSWQIE